MDVTAVGVVGVVGVVIGVVLVAAALLVALAARTEARRAEVRLAEVVAEVGQVQQDVTALKGQIDEMKEPLQQLQELEGLQLRLEMIHALAGAAADRAQRVDQRLSEIEGKFQERAAPASPPPIPSGRPEPGLEDLRALLRAQAAKSATETERDHATTSEETKEP